MVLAYAASLLIYIVWLVSTHRMDLDEHPFMILLATLIGGFIQAPFRRTSLRTPIP